MKLIRKGWGWFVLGCLFWKELALSVCDVVKTVLRPSRVEHSAIVAVPLDVKSEAGIVLLANMITLTPGTISLHIAEDRSVIYVHVMNMSPEAVNSVKNGFEKRIREVLP